MTIYQLLSLFMVLSSGVWFWPGFLEFHIRSSYPQTGKHWDSTFSTHLLNMIILTNFIFAMVGYKGLW